MTYRWFVVARVWKLFGGSGDRGRLRSWMWTGAEISRGAITRFEHFAMYGREPGRASVQALNLMVGGMEH